MWRVYIAGQIYPDPLMGQTGVIKIADLVLLPYISFIIAFTALECIGRVYESIYRESTQPVRLTPWSPTLWVKLGS